MAMTMDEMEKRLRAVERELAELKRAPHLSVRDAGDVVQYGPVPTPPRREPMVMPAPPHLVPIRPDSRPWMLQIDGPA